MKKNPRWPEKCAALCIALTFCCGFGWSRDKSDPCKDAGSIVNTLATVSDPEKFTRLEEKVIKACPNGPPGLFIKALQAEKRLAYDAAIAIYRDVLLQDPNFAGAHGNLGLLLHKKRLDEEASVELTRALMGSSDPRYHRALAAIMKEGNLPALALFHYNEALKAFPDDVETISGRAETFVQLRQYDKAAQEFARLKALRPEEIRFQLELATTYRKAGHLDKAIEEISSYLNSHGSDKEGHYLLAEILMEKGEREAAKKEYLIAGVDVTINPDDFVRKGDDYIKAKEYGQAITAYQTALKGRPAWPDVQHRLARAQISAGRDDEALATLTALVKAGVTDSAIYQELGQLHERSGQLDHAITSYRLALTYDPSKVNTRRRLAEILTWRGSFREAIEQYKELIHLREDNPLYHLNLARLYDRSRDIKQAVSEYETAIRLDPNNVEGHRELGRIFKRGGQTAKAEQHFKEVLRLQNEDETASNGLISLYVKQKRYDDLTLFIKNWLEKAPDDPQRHYRLGLVYEFKKQYELAVAEYKSAIALQPTDSARVLHALGRTYMRMGLLSESREMLEASKKADPTFAEPQFLLASIRSESPPREKVVSKKKGHKDKSRNNVRQKKTQKKRSR